MRTYNIQIDPQCSLHFSHFVASFLHIVELQIFSIYNVYFINLKKESLIFLINGLQYDYKYLQWSIFRRLL